MGMGLGLGPSSGMQFVICDSDAQLGHGWESTRAPASHWPPLDRTTVRANETCFTKIGIWQCHDILSTTSTT